MRSGNEILVNRSELIENVKKIVGI